MSKQKLFPLKQFRSFMTETQTIRSKMAPIISQFQNNNIQWMFTAISQLQRILKTPKQNIIYKFNSIFVIKVFLDLCQIPLTNMIEAYLWDYIYETATYNCASREQSKYAKYFTQKQGYEPNTKNIETYSFNYLTLAVQLIFAAAKIKPKQLFENMQLRQTDSKFVQCLKKLKGLKLEPPAKFAFYKNGFQTLRQKYIQKLKNYQIDAASPYTDYFLKLANRMIENGLNAALAAPIQKQANEPNIQLSDIKKIMAYGDLFLTKYTIDFCLKQINQNQKIHRKLNALQFLNYFIKWGDMDAYLQLLKNTTLDNIAKKIATDPKLSSAPKTLERKKYIYPEITDKKQRQKIQEFYEQYLKKIQMWADIPTAQQILIKSTNQKNVKFKQIYKFLYQKCGLSFPQNAMKQHFKIQAQKNFKKNAERSTTILEEGQQQQQQQPSNKPVQHQNQKNQTSSLNSLKAPSVKKQKAPQIKQERTPGQTPGNQLKLSLTNIITYSSFKSALITANQHIKEITTLNTNFSDKQAMKIDDYMSQLVSFQQNFQTFAENLDQDNEDKINQIMEQGISVTLKVQEIQKVYDQYKSGKMNFEEFKRIVSNNKKPKPVAQSHVQSHSKVSSQKNVNQSSLNTFNNNVAKAQNKPPVNSQISLNKPHQQKKQKQNHAVQNLIDTKPLTIKEHQEQFNQLGKNSKFQTFSQLSDSSYLDSRAKESRNSLIKQENKHQQEISSNFKKNNHKVFQQPSYDNHKPSQKQFEQLTIKNVSNVQHYDNSPYNAIKQESIVRQHDYQVNIVPSVLHTQQKKDPHKLQKHNQNIQSPIGNKPISGIFQNDRQENTQQLKQKKQMVDQILSKQLLNDFIEEPDISPLDESFYNQTQIRHQIQINKEPSFKSCFTMDKYLLSIKNASKIQKSKKQRIFWLENSAQNLMNFKIKPVSERNNSFQGSSRQSNVGESKISRKSSQNKSIFTVPELLQERNRKFKQQIKYVEKAKQQEVEQLKKKIRDLQNKGKYMENQLTKKQQQIQSMKFSSEYGDDGTKSKNDFINDQNMLFKNKMQNTYITPNKRFNRDMGFSFTSEKPKPQYTAYKAIMPQGKLISSKPYQQFYIQYKKEKQKRHFLKHKQLAFKDQQIEIGVLVHKIQEQIDQNRQQYQQSDNYLKCGKVKIIFYITPTVLLENFHYNIAQSDELRINALPKKFQKIYPNKQQRILLDVSIYNIPYFIPKIQFIYQINSRQYQKKIAVPCLFHKFLHIREMKEEFVNNEISEALRIQSLKRGEQVPYSRKILKDLKDLTIIQDYLPGLKLMNGGLTNEKGQLTYAGLCHFGGYKFLLKICIKPNQFFYIQAVNMTPYRARSRKVQQNGMGGANTKDEIVIDFSISLLSHLFMKDIDWA